MTLPANAIDAPVNPWVFVAWFGCLCGVYLFGQGVMLLRRRRHTSVAERIRDAKAGPIFVGGCAQGTGTLSAALSGKLCFYYRATVWRQEDPSRDDSWEIVAEETRGEPFVLSDVSNIVPSKNAKTEHDKSGCILVDPRSAHVDLPRDTYEEYGKTLLATFTDIPSGVDAFLKKNKVDTSAALRVEEYLLAPGAEVFVHGFAIANPALAKSGKPAHQEKRKLPRDVSAKTGASGPEPVAPQVIHLSAESANRPAVEMTMQSRVAAALALAARGQTPQTASANPLHIPSISVAVTETNPALAETKIQTHVHRHAFSEENQQKQAPALAALKSQQPSQPLLFVRQQNGSRFTISYRNLPAPTPSSVRRAAAFLAAGPLMTMASIYLLLTILGWL